MRGGQPSRHSSPQRHKGSTAKTTKDSHTRTAAKKTTGFLEMQSWLSLVVLPLCDLCAFVVKLPSCRRSGLASPATRPRYARNPHVGIGGCSGMTRTRRTLLGCAAARWSAVAPPTAPQSRTAARPRPGSQLAAFHTPVTRNRSPMPESTPPVADTDRRLAASHQLRNRPATRERPPARRADRRAAGRHRRGAVRPGETPVGAEPRPRGRLLRPRRVAAELRGRDAAVRPASTFMAGLGPNVVFAFSDAVYAPLAARQDVRARQAQSTSRHQRLDVLQVAEAYFSVQPGPRRVGRARWSSRSTRRNSCAAGRGELAKGLAAPPEETPREGRTRAPQAVHVITARERWRTASADLARLLRLDPSAVVEPVEPPFLPVSVIDATYGGRWADPDRAHDAPRTRGRTRPSCRRPWPASSRRRFARWCRASRCAASRRTRAGRWAGAGSSGGPNGTSGGRFDIDMQMLWEFQALGFGNRARVSERKAEHEAATLELFRTQDRIAAEVVQAFAQVRSAAERANEAEPALREALDLVDKSLEGLGQTRRVGDALVLVVAATGSGGGGAVAGPGERRLFRRRRPTTTGRSSASTGRWGTRPSVSRARCRIPSSRRLEPAATGKTQGLSLLQVRVEELGDLVLHLGRGEPGPAVPAALDDDQFRLHARLLQRVQQNLALADRHERVGVAVQHQHRRVVLRHERERVRLRRLLLVLLDRPADELRLGRTRRRRGRSAACPWSGRPSWSGRWGRRSRTPPARGCSRPCARRRSPSNSFTSPLVPRRATRCPPADDPHAPKASGLRLNVLAFARRNRTAALQSSICAGKTACWLRR